MQKPAESNLTAPEPKGSERLRPAGAALSADSAFIMSCVPKCGMRWLSSMLTALGFARYPEARDLQGAMIETVDAALGEMGPGCFFSHHINIELVLHLVRRADVPCFVLVRDPRDAMVSLYHWTRSKGLWADRSFDDVFGYDLMWRTFRNFVFYGLHWMERYDRSHLVHYEDLLEDAGPVLHRMLATVSARAPDSAVAGAVAKYSRNRLRTNDGETAKYLHFRAGSVGEFREHFSGEQMDVYRRVMGEVHVRLGYEL